MGETVTVRLAGSEAESAGLERMIWEVLWEPVGLPWSVTEEFRPDGERVEVVATRGTDLVGGLVGNWRNPAQMLLSHMAVREAHRGRDIGRRMVAKLIEIARERDAEVIGVVSRNTSMGFYEKLGFVPVPGQKITHPAFDPRGIHFEVMALPLKPQ